MCGLNEDFLFLQQSVASIIKSSLFPSRSFLISKIVNQKEDKVIGKTYRVSVPNLGEFESDMVSPILYNLINALQNEARAATTIEEHKEVGILG